MHLPTFFKLPALRTVLNSITVLNTALFLQLSKGDSYDDF
jgi:hypothetical protein